jgi:hypothetical protein
VLTVLAIVRAIVSMVNVHGASLTSFASARGMEYVPLQFVFRASSTVALANVRTSFVIY